MFVYERQDIEGMAQQRYEWDEMKEEIIDETKWNENECIEETWLDLTWLSWNETKQNETSTSTSTSYLPIIANQAINTQNKIQDITGGILNGSLLPFVWRVKIHPITKTIENNNNRVE